MKNDNPSHSFNSLRKSPKRKKMKIEYESNISFWDNVKDTNCEEEARSESEFTEFSFTSFEIEHSKKSAKHITSIKFIIREIEREEDCVRLISNDVVCTVFGEWTELDYEIDTKITVTPCICCTHELARDFIDSKIHIRVDDNTNYLFIEDDLMTITNLCSSIRCYNRPMVNSKVADINFEFRDKCLVNGIILHDVMEEVLINKNYTLAYIKEAVRKATENNALNIYACNTTERSVKNDIFTSLTNISRFKRHNLVFEQSEKRIVSLISNLKGNIDVVGENIVLEIKSGKSMDVSHKAQVILYNLLMKERFFRDFDCYLYYIANDNLVKIDVKHSEVKSLFIRRNKLTLKNDIEICNCQAFEPCQIINKILSLPSDHFLKQTWDAIEKEENYRLKETWNSVTIKKQSDTNVVFKFDFDPSIIDDIYINIYNQDLIKLCKGIIASFENNIMMVSLSERINLENNSHYFISFGCNDLFFKYLRYSLINIAFFRYVDSSNGHGFKLPGEEFQLGNESDIEDFNSSSDSLNCDSLEFNDKSINKSNIEITNQLDDVFMKTIETTPIKNTNIASIRNVSSSLDLNTALLKNSASSLDSSFQYFTPSTPPKVTYKYQIPEIYKDQFFSLNEEQKNSLFLSLNCENYKIIHGMPGTGKSTIIVLLIKILISLNFKVLLVCYTNLAITNILVKLKTVRFYRARKEKIEFKLSDEVKKYYDNIDLVASTCFGFSDTIFIDRKFDFCIIDEGSQQHLLLTLIPVSLSNRFVIFGDHLQLKPLVKSCKFLSTSLFEYLLDEDHSELHTQYRMGKNIMRLSNELFYGNKLIAANDFKDKVVFIDSTDINYSEFISNVKNSTILCYFNSQVKLTKLHTNCQVETIDRFQGSEDENVIIVFDPVSSCEVMESHERLNVALTRARRSLTLVGDKEKMMEVDILRRLLVIL